LIPAANIRGDVHGRDRRDEALASVAEVVPEQRGGSVWHDDPDNDDVIDGDVAGTVGHGRHNDRSLRVKHVEVGSVEILSDALDERSTRNAAGEAD